MSTAGDAVTPAIRFETVAGSESLPDARPHILVVEPSYLGDVILGFPVLNALHRIHGDRSVVVLVRAGHESLISAHPVVADVILYRPGETHEGLAGVWRLANELRGRGFNTALVFPGSIKTVVAVWLARIPRRIGADPGMGLTPQLSLVIYPAVVRSLPNVRRILLFERMVRWLQWLSGGRLRLLTDVIPQPGQMSMADRKLLWLSPLDIPHAKAKTIPWLTVADARGRQKGVNLERQIVALAPGATWNTRRWPEDRFAALADMLEADGFTVCILGGRNDTALAQRIAQLASSPHVVSVAGELTLIESMALLRQCTVLISNDTAPVHMASAVGTPTVALFGPTLPSFGFAPLAPQSRVLERSGLSCRPCTVYGSPTCPVGTLACLTSISVQEVYAAAREIAEARRSNGMPEDRKPTQSGNGS